MKTRLVVLLFAMVTAFGLRTFQAQAEVSFSAGIEISSPADFYDPLAASGAWVSIHQYGRCWHPARVEAGWRPYTVGHWEWTDVGWYWVSDEPWAWACYHYGSWTLDPTYGWIWVPGVEWAPSWVSWRVGDGYCGWAPLPPPGVVIVPSFFVFVEERRFHEHHSGATHGYHCQKYRDRDILAKPHGQRSRQQLYGGGLCPSAFR